MSRMSQLVTVVIGYPFDLSISIKGGEETN